MKKAGDLLGAFFDESTMKSARGYCDLFSAWRSIAGERISAHSRIAELDKNILLVEADHPGWIQIIQLQQAAILESVRRRFPELTISAIALRLQRDAGPEIKKDLSRHAEDRGIPEMQAFGDGGAPVPDRNAETEDPYGKIPDGDLKEILRKLEHSIKTRNHDR